MNSEELLAIARQSYPKGTKFICPYSKKEYVSRGDYFSYSEIENSVYQPGAYFYYGGEWAEIVEVQVNDLFLI